MIRSTFLSPLLLSSLLLVIVACETPSNTEAVGAPGGKKKPVVEKAKETGLIEPMELICPLPEFCIKVKEFRLASNRQEPTEDINGEPVNIFPIASELVVFNDDESEKGDLVELFNKANQRPLDRRVLSVDGVNTRFFDLASILFYDDRADYPILMISVFYPDQEMDELPFLQMFFELKITENDDILINNFTAEAGDRVRDVSTVAKAKGLFSKKDEESPSVDDQEDPAPTTTDDQEEDSLPPITYT